MKKVGPDQTPASRFMACPVWTVAEFFCAPREIRPQCACDRAFIAAVSICMSFLLALGRLCVSEARTAIGYPFRFFITGGGLFGLMHRSKKRSYSITSSVVAGSYGWNSSLSVLAVLRLIT